ncbi:MAG: hypothetical protein M3Q45_03790 [Chloroflexota bacterium]|nr:hypothetical protein [Chloroflexota bacterium]
MNTNHRWNHFAHHTFRAEGDAADQGWWRGGIPSGGGYGSLWESLSGRGVEVSQASDEVAAQQAGRIALVSRNADLPGRLLAHLRQQPYTEVAAQPIQHEGLFTLVYLGGPDALDDNVGAVDTLPPVECLLYLIHQSDGWQAGDTGCCARLRSALGAPILPVIYTAAHSSGSSNLAALVQAHLGVRPTLIGEQLSDLLPLVQRILRLRPGLAAALAGEAPAFRPWIVRDMIRTTACMTTLLGAEPVPLLDVPLHVALYWKLALRIATAYGRPGLDYGSREMIGVIVLNLAIRQAAQQLLKLTPLVGWLLSALLSGISTWLFGRALMRYYQEERLW